MTNYLTVITTILVITQVIRVTQNAINLHRQKILYKKELKGLADLEPTKEDFKMQAKAYRLIVEKLSAELGEKKHD